MIRLCAPTAVLAVAAWASLASPTASAEPYFAVQKGLQCGACHAHPAGGGKRNAYGNVFARNELAASRIGNDEPWTGRVNDWLAVGANLRAGFDATDTPGTGTESTFDVNRGTVYLEAAVIPSRLLVYVDQQFAPGGAQNREAYVRLNGEAARWFVAAGQFYLPYGLRLQDDTAFVRLATGVNLTNPDRGVQAGYEAGPWSIIGAVTNGSGGSADRDDGKQLSLISSYVRANWRLGLSASRNDADAGDRDMVGLFAGLKTGPIAWLAEIDRVRDDVPAAQATSAIASLVEANLTPGRGHNLKFSYEYLDPDDDVSEDHRVRYSIVWEYSPVQFLQSRLGVRSYDGPPESPGANRDAVFWEFHGFF